MPVGRGFVPFVYEFLFMISRMSDRRPIKILKVHYQDEADLKRRIWHTKMNSRVDYTKCQVSKIEDLLQLP